MPGAPAAQAAVLEDGRRRKKFGGMVDTAESQVNRGQPSVRPTLLQDGGASTRMIAIMPLSSCPRMWQ
jgi:hypothetical protein